MPVSYTIDGETRLLRTCCHGDVSFQEVIAHFRELEADESLPQPVDVLLDLTETASLPDTSQIRSVAIEVERLGARVEWGACALVASSDALYGMTRMFHAFVDRAFAASNVFRDLEEAERWLATVRSTSTST